ELDAQDADVIERRHDASRDVDGLPRRRRRHAGGHHRYVEDVAIVRVLDRTEMRPFAAGAARADDRNFAIQVDEPFEDGFGAAVRTHERARLGRFGRRRRHVLELEGDDVDGAGEGADGIEIVVRRVDFDVRHLSRRRVVVRGERVHAVAEAARRHGEHAAQLAAAKDAYRGSGGDDAGHYIADL